MFGTGTDVVVMGAGPAGLSIAGACARLGLRVVCVAPDPSAIWPQSFAMWAAEADTLGCGGVVEASFAEPAVWLDDRSHLTLPFSYSRIDVPRWQATLQGACAASGVVMRTGLVTALAHEARATTATLADGGSLCAPVFVDATGAGTRFVRRSAGGPIAFQSAYGELIETSASIPMALMDYRGPAGDGPPSFLYALPLDDGRVFVEETVLASRPAAPMALLSARLRRRLWRMGVVRARTLAVERCVIPLGVPLPARGERVIAFGAAASLVHPATGYQVARAVRLAPALAAAIAGSRTPDEAAARGWAAVWPRSQRLAWGLYTFGMEAICGFDLDGLRAFLRAFFQLPPERWWGFLRGTESPLAIATSMARVLGHADPRLRADLLRLLVTRRPPVSPLLEGPA
jgi:lycopene cyclase-like protein